MNEENRVYLIDMQRNLQARMNYDHPSSAFRILLLCFAKYKRHKTGWAGSIFRQGWMSPVKAHEFALYVGYPIDQN